MIAKKLITDDIVPVKTSDTCHDVNSLMEEYKVSHLPVVNNVEFLGLISEKDIFSASDSGGAIGNLKLSQPVIFTSATQHIFDVYKIMGIYELTLIPVVDSKKKYLGSVTLESINRYLSKASFINSPGGIIVLEMGINNYSLSEISQIVESNNAKIMGMFIETDGDSTKIEVSLKLSKIDIDAILQTFTRYDYYIKASFSEKDTVFQDLNDRYDSLMNYLDIGNESK